MATRQTRASAAKAATLPASSNVEARPQQLSSPPATPAPVSKKKGSKKSSKSKKAGPTKSPAKEPSTVQVPATPATTGKKRKRAAIPKVEDEEDLPHGLGGSLRANRGQVNDKESDEEEPALKKLASNSLATSIGKAKAKEIITNAVDKASPAKSPKKKNYGHTPGKTPYPEWLRPTAEECQIVHDLLTEIHGLHAAPETIPAPSSTYAGCGEVPSILDALIRTYLSASTKGVNAGRSIQGINKTFSKLKEGTGKGSPDYNEIRLADISVLLKAIETGGLGNVKSKHIKGILDMVYEENQTHRDAYKKRKETGRTDEVETNDGTITLEKSAELTCANPNVLTLDHMHALSDNETFNKFLTFPGIGVKTAACVMLFCMKRPSFAVDTHVFRLCKWLGWVPDNATRDKTFSHCEVMIPHALKYGLHQLFIKHGKTCGRCKAMTGESSEGWEKGCVIDHLVNRTGLRKGGQGSPAKKGKKAKGKSTKGKKNAASSEEEDVKMDSD